ncbi:hypothetical protein B0H13DRAFT_2037375 [Mycena leptocephala]|nr:hypothetical protein B0H13DRAFT_2037375 [Mycena leptocephala]
MSPGTTMRGRRVHAVKTPHPHLRHPRSARAADHPHVLGRGADLGFFTSVAESARFSTAMAQTAPDAWSIAFQVISLRYPFTEVVRSLRVLRACTGSDYRNDTKSLATALAALVVYSSAMTLQEDPERLHGKGREGRRAEGSETKICALSPPLPQPHASFDGRGEASDVAWTLNDPPLRPDPIILPCTAAQSRASTISKRSVRRLSGTAVYWDCPHIHDIHPRPLTIVLAPRTAPQLRDIQAYRLPGSAERRLRLPRADIRAHDDSPISFRANS